MSELFFVECDGKINGRRAVWFAERDMDRTGLSNTVDDIISGDLVRVCKVYRADTETGRFADVSEDVAREIINRLDTDPAGDLLDFCEGALGCRVMANFAREVA